MCFYSPRQVFGPKLVNLTLQKNLFYTYQKSNFLEIMTGSNTAMFMLTLLLYFLVFFRWFFSYFLLFFTKFYVSWGWLLNMIMVEVMTLDLFKSFESRKNNRGKAQQVSSFVSFWIAEARLALGMSLVNNFFMKLSKMKP